MLILKLLILVTVANGTPVIVKKLLDLALDGGLNFFDGRRLFGPSKTIRGVVSAVLATILCTMLMELEWFIGFINKSRQAHFRWCRVISGRQLKRTVTTDEPTPTEV